MATSAERRAFGLTSRSLVIKSAACWLRDGDTAISPEELTGLCPVNSTCANTPRAQQSTFSLYVPWSVTSGAMNMPALAESACSW
jgi:hypothetical protein